MKDRAGKANVKKNTFFNNIKCNETKHLGKACTPGVSN